jgi:hypothetical protein
MRKTGIQELGEECFRAGEQHNGRPWCEKIDNGSQKLKCGQKEWGPREREEKVRGGGQTSAQEVGLDSEGKESPCRNEKQAG